VTFLEQHRGDVAFVTIDIGANDLWRLDAPGNPASCLFEPAGCDFELARMQNNLTAILAELRTAVGPAVPIVGMTYHDVLAPACVADASLLIACARLDGLNAALAGTYAAAGAPVADVAGAFENDDLANAANNVCAWTWICSSGDVHPNAAGHAEIAKAIEQVLP
jgi:lysophospholipase L1-like esterase